MRGWAWPKKAHLQKSERRKQRKGRAYNQRQRKRKLRGLENQKRDREDGGYR